MMRFSRTRRLIFGLAAVAVAAALPAAASAGTFNVNACSSGTSWVNHAWTTQSSAGGQFDFLSNCGISSASTVNGVDVTRALALDTQPVSMTAPAAATWSISAPAGTTLTRLTYSRQMRIFNSGVWRVQTKADSTELEGCQLGPLDSECNVSAGTRSSTTFSSLNASTIQFGTSCTSGCIGGGTTPAVAVAASSLTVTVTDPVDPTANDLTGSLDGGTNLTGTQTVSVGGSDTTGIKSVEALVDGNVVASTNNANCDFTYTRPCAQITPSFSSTFNVDVTSLSNGTHTLTGRVYDAANNVSIKTSNFTVANPTTPPPPTGGTGGSTQPPPPPTPANSQLRLSSARLTGKKAAASGTLAKNASGKITVKLTWRDSKKKTHSKTYSVKRSGSKWSLSTNFTPRKASMSIRFSGNAGWASTSIVKSLSAPKK